MPGVAKAGAKPKEAAQAPAAGRQVALTQEEVQRARELLESVMTIAAHGILYRWGQSLGARVLADANRRGGNLTDAAAGALVDHGWAREVRFFTAKVQVVGSIEAKESVEPCCHLMRGLLHVVVAGGDGGVIVREEACAGQGHPECTFSIARGPRHA